MSKDQRDAIVRYTHPLDESLTVSSCRTKHNRRYRAIVAQDGDQILREWWPLEDPKTGKPDRNRRRQQLSEAIVWLDGYRMAKVVYR